MGRLSMSVDIFEILTLAWDHPLIAGVFMLMFTPPFFPVLVFFSPLLISTALCAVALISMGQQMEDASKREREVAGWNARGPADGDPPAARERPIRRRRVPGEDNWLDWVKGGLEPGSVWGQTESSTFIEDVKEDRLLADFRVDEGGIDMKEEEYRQQIEAFRAFERNLGERSFSFRTGAAVAATIVDALDSPVEDSSMRLVPFQNTATSPQIPPMFLYTLKTGGTGTGGSNAIANLTEAGSAGQRPSRPTQQPQQQLQGGQEQQQQQQQKKTLVPYGSGFPSGNFGEPENDNQRQLLPQPEPQQLQQKKILGSFGSGFYSGGFEEPKKDNERQHHALQQQDKMLVPFSGGNIAGSLEGPKKDNQRPPRQQQHGELLSVGSEIVEGSFKEPEQQQLHQRGISSQTQVSPAEPAHLLKSLAKGSFAEAAYSYRSASKGSSSSQNPVKSSHEDSRDSDRRTSIFDFAGDRGDAKPRPSQERFKALTYNASLIPGNAVIYTAEPSPIDSKQLQKRNALSNRERRGSSTTPRQRRKHEMAARHALQFEKENNSSGNWITTTTRRE